MTLYVVPTPIGNLEDVTLRSLRVLSEVSVIFAEDTRHTRKLLTHFDIHTRLLSYHQHNKRAKLDTVLAALAEGDVALVSSAGMPAVSDPGFELIEAAVAAGFEVDVLPGPSAGVTAVVAAALPAAGFLFLGFLPRRSKDRRERLDQVAGLPFSLVLYEAPHRLLETLSDLETALGNRPMVAARELTKVHQELLRGSIAEIRAHFDGTIPRGEFTLVVAGGQPAPADRTEEAAIELRRRRHEGQEAKRAVTEVAKVYGLSRNAAYQLWLDQAE